jgi:hypothetical protein
MLLGAGDSVLISRVDCLLRLGALSCSTSSSRDLLAPACEDSFVSGSVETGASSAVSFAYFNLRPIFFQAGTCCDILAISVLQR